MEKRNARAATKVRDVFLQEEMPLTLAYIASKTALKAPEVSMALCYLRRQRWLTRELIANNSGKGRKQVWIYKYHPQRLNAVECAST